MQHILAGCIDTGNPVADHNARKLATKHRRLRLITVGEIRATSPPAQCAPAPNGKWKARSGVGERPTTVDQRLHHLATDVDVRHRLTTAFAELALVV